MITRIGMAPRLPSLDITGFQEHWRSSHADAAAKIPGVRRYVQNHAVLVDGHLPFPYPGFDACSELDFDGLAAMDAGFASDQYRQEVRADEGAFVDKDRFSLVLTERQRLRGGDVRPDAVKLMTFLRAHPAASPRALHRVLTGAYATALAGGASLRHELFLPVDTERSQREVAACDAVDVLWFPDVRTALDEQRTDRAERAAWELAGLQFGALRLLARPHTVI